MRISILWQGISGYLSASWKALAALPNVKLSILSAPTFRDYDLSIIAGLDAQVMTKEECLDPEYTIAWLKFRQPEVILLAGWISPVWNQIPHHPDFKDIPFVLAFDTPWRGDLRQHLAQFKLRKLLARMNRALVPGERGFQYARRLGFPDSKISRGMYGIDFDALSSVYEHRLAENNNQWPKKFLYFGRYAEEKAIDVLIQAYRLYCQRTPDPWPLTACGSGEKANLFEGVPNLTNRGFIQPPEQPELWRTHGAFVLASRYDPWPLVVVEAAAAGLPIICTESCGSSVELVRSQFNGLPVAADDPEALANAMLWMHNNYDQCPAMGARSRELAAAYSAQTWAKRIMHMCSELIA